MATAILANFIAKNPASILVLLGGIGWLFKVDGSGILLFLGITLNIGWLGVKLATA